MEASFGSVPSHEDGCDSIFRPRGSNCRPEVFIHVLGNYKPGKILIYRGFNFFLEKKECFLTEFSKISAQRLFRDFSWDKKKLVPAGRVDFTFEIISMISSRF